MARAAQSMNEAKLHTPRQNEHQIKGSGKKEQEVKEIARAANHTKQDKHCHRLHQNQLGHIEHRLLKTNMPEMHYRGVDLLGYQHREVGHDEYRGTRMEEYFGKEGLPALWSIENNYIEEDIEQDKIAQSHYSLNEIAAVPILLHN